MVEGDAMQKWIITTAIRKQVQLGLDLHQNYRNSSLWEDWFPYYTRLPFALENILYFAKITTADLDHYGFQFSGGFQFYDEKTKRNKTFFSARRVPKEIYIITFKTNKNHCSISTEEFKRLNKAPETDEEKLEVLNSILEQSDIITEDAPIAFTMYPNIRTSSLFQDPDFLKLFNTTIYTNYQIYKCIQFLETVDLIVRK